MTKKDTQELICLSRSINAMRKQFLKNLDAVATRVEILLSEDTATQGIYHKGSGKKNWEKPESFGGR